MIGQRIRRREDPRFITGKGQYVDDLQLPGALHAAFVRSDLAHARIATIDASEATALPGVQVLTAADIDLGVLAVPFPGVPAGMFRPFMADGKVRFVGEILAVVLAQSREQAADAAELVFAELESLPAVIEPDDAMRDETLLFEELGSNIALADGPREPSAELFAGCEVVSEGAVVSQRIHVAPIEPRANAARFADGRLTTWLCTQTPHQDRDRLADSLGLDPGQVHVLAPDVGGGFGGKGLGVEDVIVAWLARRTGRPVRWTDSTMVGMSRGETERRSITSSSTPSSAAIAADFSAVATVGPYAISVTSRPGRTTRALYSGYGSSSISPFAPWYRRLGSKKITGSSSAIAFWIIQ